jgi:hypothetical protein
VGDIRHASDFAGTQILRSLRSRFEDIEARTSGTNRCEFNCRPVAAMALGSTIPGLSVYHRDVLVALFIRLNQFGNTVVEGGEFAFVVLSQG